MRATIVFITLLLAGCVSLIPANPQEAREKISRDMHLPLQTIQSVSPCIFAVTPPYVRRAEFTECAIVVGDDSIYIARALTNEQRFDTAATLQYAQLRGFSLLNWGLGASQLQFIRNDSIISVHLKSGGRETFDQPAEAKRIAALLTSKGVPEVVSPGRVDQAVDAVIPIIIPSK